MKIENNEYFALLKEWTDALLEVQITEMNHPAFYGGLLCPACGHIHGRCADSVYPFVFMADQTGDKRYFDAAVRVVDWAENNVLRPDGSYFNDCNNTWKGITAFSANSMAETLLHHKDIIPDNIYQKWFAILKRQADFVYWYFDSAKTNINYFASASSTLALAWKLTSDEKYLQKAKFWANHSAKHIDEYGIFYGEGQPTDLVTNKGCRAVDVGYNVEESLPSLVTYCRITGDNEMLEKIKFSMKTHLEFMLPDGGWDNSFGSRNPKWTYWGSRTSDGCQIAYAALADEDPAFGEAAHRSFQQYKACTHDGLLHGGPMYKDAGEPPCIHHTFEHAKAVAFMLDMGFQRGTPVSLPRDESYGTKSFPSAGVTLLSTDNFLATFANTDHGSFRATPTGGTMSLLWHKNYGPVCAASMTDYVQIEPLNMQFPKNQNEVTCQTPRFEYCRNDCKFISSGDTKASLNAKGLTVTAKGILCNSVSETAGNYEISNTFENNTLTMSLKSTIPCTYHLPIISSKSDKVSLTNGKLMIESAKYSSLLTLEADKAVIMIDGDSDTRNLNPVGGFLSLPVYVTVEPNKELVLKLTIELNKYK